MFEPIIKLTKFEEMLVVPNIITRDEERLTNCIGTHFICRGNIHLKKISKTFQAIICLDCNMRIVIPIEVITYGDLRRYLAQNLTRN